MYWEVFQAIFDKQYLSLEYDSLMKELALTTRERDVMAPVILQLVRSTFASDSFLLGRLSLLRDILTCTIRLAYMDDPDTCVFF